MRIGKLFLRWYKSFNVNYTGYPDRKSGVERRPWNLLGRSAETESDFPFIEISLEDDITTVVGANESGKSHLLSAISKVLTGQGIPEFDNATSTYSRTDLCHYTSPRSKNAEDWPNIGLQFKDITQEELQAVGNAIGQPSLGKTTASPSYVFTLVIAPDNDGTEAYVYLNDAEGRIELDNTKLTELRQCLPRVAFIKSDLAISDQVPVGAVLSALGCNAEEHLFGYKAAQQVSAQLLSIAIPNPNAQLPQEVTKTLLELQEKLRKADLAGHGNSELEALLFRDVLGITPETLKFVADLDVSARTHADGLAATWNREIEETLNLSHYWQQDDSFALKIAYRQGVIYFEITDKTGATYTFKERSSGLRYFLSYYIQAKALESTSRETNTIVLMDEPDCFLSILGQRNLLSVFESLVRPESSVQNCQLVYTTHSPFLINRNYPRRLRLVRKGDAEEGTQVVVKAMLRRYEPVRSALGIDCAQTLFMGATNVVVEGPTDQYIICELVRFFATPENVNELLDLNSIVMVSAESAPGVEKLLAASKWGDESIPATVVLLDSDMAGDEARKRITGKARNCKKLIDDEFVLQIGDLLDGEDVQKFVTTEDLIPAATYVEAVLRYVSRWHPEVSEEKRTQLKKTIREPTFAANGLVEGTRVAMNQHVHDADRDYDKLGVLQQVVETISEAVDGGASLPSDIGSRLRTFCEAIRRAVSSSQQLARRTTGKQAIQRLIDEFFVTHKQASSVFDVQLLLDRIKKDAELLGIDGEELDACLKRMSGEIEKTRSSGQHQFVGDRWAEWKAALGAIRKNPLGVTVTFADGVPSVGESEEAKEPTTDEPTNGKQKTVAEPANAS
jgi:predicted ATP-dependent endonuclease of OLD family